MNCQNRFFCCSLCCFCYCFCCMHFTTYLYGGAKRPPNRIHTAEAAAETAEAVASKSVLAIHSIYEKLSNELPTYQVLPNELPEFGNSLDRSWWVWQFISLTIHSIKNSRCTTCTSAEPAMSPLYESIQDRTSPL